MQTALGPCVQTPLVVHIITAVGMVLTSCFTAYLAHRRIKADRVQNMRFMDQRIQLDQINRTVNDTNEKIDGGAKVTIQNGRQSES